MADFSELRSSISKLQSTSVALDTEKADAEKYLKKLLRKWRRVQHGHGRAWCRKAHRLLKKIKSWLGIGGKACGHNSLEEGRGVLGHEQPSNLGASRRLKPRIGRYPAWLKEQQEKERERDEHDIVSHLDNGDNHFGFGHGRRKWKLIKKIAEAAKRVQASNQKLVAFERGFIHEDGIKDREWFRHLGVAPGKWLGTSYF